LYLLHISYIFFLLVADGLIALKDFSLYIKLMKASNILILHVSFMRSRVLSTKFIMDGMGVNNTLLYNCFPVSYELPADWVCWVIHVTPITSLLLHCICMHFEEERTEPSLWFHLVCPYFQPLPSSTFKMIVSDPW
jgi:hypothetical protein